MKRIVLALLVLGALACRCEAACTSPCVQVASNYTCVTPTNPCTKAYAGSVTTGNLLVVATLNNGAGPVVSTVSDSVNGTWTQAKAQTLNFSTKDLELWYFPNTASGTPTVSVTYTSAPGNASLIIVEYSTVFTSSPLDKTASARSTDGGGGTSLDSGATATTSQANELLIGVGGAANSETFTAGTSYTIRDQGNNAEGVMLEDQVVSATGAYHMTATDNSSQDWGAIIVTFKTNAAAVTCIPMLSTLGVSSCGNLEDSR